MRRAATHLFSLLAVFVLCACQPAWPQSSVDEHEKQISSLPAPQRAFERFRFWSTQLPPGQSPSFDSYRGYLNSRGFSSADIDAQIRLIQQQGERAEVDRWNRILTSEKPTFNVKPNDFLVEMAQGRKPGTALDVGMGQGRNTIWLAQQGWDATGFDPAEKAVSAAQKTAAALGVKIHTFVQGQEQFDFGQNRWDLILMSYVGGRGMAERIQRALRPGGILVLEAFHRDATRGNSIGPDVVFDTGELPRLFPGLRAVRYEEPVRKADFGQQLVRVVRYCAQKPE